MDAPAGLPEDAPAHAPPTMPIYRFVQPRLGRGRLDTWRLRAFRMVALLAALIAICAVGLALLDNSDRDFQGKLMLGLWNALNLVTTLGDFSSFDAKQRGFMLFIMLGVIGLGAYSMSQLTGILSSEAVVAYKENRDMEKTLDKLAGHAVVIGYLGVARTLARGLREGGMSVVIIERDEERGHPGLGRGLSRRRRRGGGRGRPAAQGAHRHRA